MIISGATDYRRYQAAAAKHRYAIRFAGVAYGRSEPLRSFNENGVQDEGMPETDPDLLSGVVDAPPQLTMGMASLVRFKTSTLTAFGLQRNGVWGLLPHGPHNVRDVLATHILKQTGSYEQASYAIQDTPEMVQSHYGRFLPQDKAALAAKILNQVWEAA